MAHHEDTSHLSKEELEFRDYIKRGDDFMTIQIYRSAKEWYQKARETNLDNNTAMEKLRECNAKLKTESHTIITVVAIAAVVVAAIVLFRYL